MTIVSEAYTWVAFEAELKIYLGVVGSGEDADLKLWWEGAALTAADTFIDRDFVDSETGLDIDITTDEFAGIKLGLFQFMKIYRGGQPAFLRDPTVKSEKVDDLSKSYGSIGEFVASIIETVSYHWWCFKDVIFL